MAEKVYQICVNYVWMQFYRGLYKINNNSARLLYCSKYSSVCPLETVKVSNVAVLLADFLRFPLEPKHLFNIFSINRFVQSSDNQTPEKQGPQGPQKLSSLKLLVIEKKTPITWNFHSCKHKKWLHYKILGEKTAKNRSTNNGYIAEETSVSD